MPVRTTFQMGFLPDNGCQGNKLGLGRRLWLEFHDQGSLVAQFLAVATLDGPRILNQGLLLEDLSLMNMAQGPVVVVLAQQAFQVKGRIVVARFLAVQDPKGVGGLMRVDRIAVNHAGIYPTFGIGEAIAAHGLVVSKGDIDSGHFLVFEEVNIIGIWDRLTLHA